MEQIDTDIAIIGGGLVGASLALALQADAKQRGWRIRLIEPFKPGDSYQPSYDARSSALSFGTRLIYQKLGLWEAIAQHAEPIKQIKVLERGRLGSTRLEAQKEGVPALGYVVDNAWIGHCLWQALDQNVVTLDYPAKVQQLKPQVGGYQLHLEDGRQLNCALAVLADGGRSELREQLGIHIKTRSYDQTALIANVTVSAAHAGQAFECFTEHGPLALLPLSGHNCALVWTRPADDALRLAALDESAFLLELQHAFGSQLGQFTQVGRRYAYPLALVEAEEQVRSHLVLLGNSAHSLHPIAGQGYNLSLRDVITLAETLVKSPEAPGHLATLLRYQERQHLDQCLTIGFSDQLVRLFGQGSPWVARARSVGLVALDNLPILKHWFARQAMGLGVRP
ncbi:2-octaprenyl-6-methoxyphenol hydroxylase [Azomonas agilis]|uniref:2-octaprenyl-6-methoxyphenol hydroxylase n=1 Tax=Azomonas agilis TaxID=116849 RepID=A0A562IKK1_9GAMM|nr:2-octaprenyl-6-methoxyphenol hydroxylase [Azomonas agilis]